jgi:ribosomal protein L24
MAAARIRTGDIVKVIAGDDKGSTGKVLKIDAKKNLVIVEGMNIGSKHVKPMKEGESGSIAKKEMPIHMSNVALTDDQPEKAVAALAVGGARAPAPVMRGFPSRSWVPFMTEAAAEEDAAEEDAAEEQPKKQRRSKKDVSAWLDADPNELIGGTVRSIMPYGAFVTLPDGQDGLLHVSQMSDEFTSNPEDIVKVGDEIQVRVIKVDMEKSQVALSLKDPSAKRPQRQPRGGSSRADKTAALKELDGNYDPKVFVPGTVASVQDFGAFVKLESGVEGLVHISQIRDGYLGNVNEAVAVGDEVQVRIEKVDVGKQQLRLSMLEWQDPAEAGEERSSRGGGGSDMGFGADVTADQLSATEMEGLKAGYDEETASWLDVAMDREKLKAAKKASGEKYQLTV